MIKGQLNRAIKSTKAFHEYQETKTKMSSKDRKRVMYVLEERDEIIDFAKVYEKLTGEKYDESVQKEIEEVKNKQRR